MLETHELEVPSSWPRASDLFEVEVLDGLGWRSAEMASYDFDAAFVLWSQAMKES